MKFYPLLYVDPEIKKTHIIKWKLLMGIGMPNVYVISLSHTMDQLDIFKADLLKQRHLRKREVYIVGIANSRKAAIDLVLKMTKEVVENTGNANLKKYILDKIDE